MEIMAHLKTNPSKSARGPKLPATCPGHSPRDDADPGAGAGHPLGKPNKKHGGPLRENPELKVKLLVG